MLSSLTATFTKTTLWRLATARSLSLGGAHELGLGTLPTLRSELVL